MKTQEQILARINEIKDADFFGFQTDDLVLYLDYEHAKPYLNEGTTEEGWAILIADRPSPAVAIKNYMDFAWGKANCCRGLSAGRSVEHMKAWLWLDDKEDLANRLDDVYEYYGKPCLVLVCQEYDINWRVLDNGEWVDNEGEKGISAEKALASKGIPA